MKIHTGIVAVFPLTEAFTTSRLNKNRLHTKFGVKCCLSQLTLNTEVGMRSVFLCVTSDIITKTQMSSASEAEGYISEFQRES